MNITYEQLFSGCLLSSIAHAIMTNAYPELSYEQSWDGNNYSIQDGNGRRATISFLDNCCIGAVSSEHGTTIQGLGAIKECLLDFPADLQLVAETETLQYLLVEHDNMIIPSVTSLFWCDKNGLYTNYARFRSFLDDISIFEICCLPLDAALKALISYYDMEPAACRLLLTLWEQKCACFSRRIILSEEQKLMLPNEFIHSACVESLSELNIFI